MIYMLGRKRGYGNKQDQLCYMGKWMITKSDNIWWEDNNLLGVEDYWAMVNRLQDGNWRTE